MTKKQAQNIVNKLDSLTNMANVLRSSQMKCDTLVKDLQNELHAYKQLDSTKNSSISDLDSLISEQEIIINDQYELLDKKESTIKKQKKRFRILGGASGGALFTLLLLVLL